MIEAQYDVLEKVIVHGDLSKLSPAERVTYYARVCESLGLNPLTRPFDYIVLNGKLTLYANRSAADQLRKVHGISTEIVSQQQVGDLYVVHVRARDREGRVDEDLGVVSIKGLAGEALANAILKAITKAKRRVTLSLAGLGWLDETEVDSIPTAEPVALEPGPANQQEQPTQGRKPVMDRGLAILRRMRKREREQGVPVGEQLEWLTDQGWLGVYVAERIKQGVASDDEIAAALATLDDDKLRALGAFCDQQAALRAPGS